MNGIKKVFFLIFAALITGSILFSCADKKENKNKGAYFSGEYRNLFLENGFSGDAIDARVERTFHQLFHDENSLTIYRDAGTSENGSKAFILDTNNEDVLSEGMAFGMMICVQMDKKNQFDALWNWAVTHMYVTDEEHPNQGYFRWSMYTDGTPQAETPAPGAEEYFVMALYFAANRWGDGEGIYNYKVYADKILSDMRHRAVITGPTLYGERTLGPMVNEKHKMILFVPDAGSDQFTSPSYHLPGFYELWALWGPEEDREFWAAAAASGRKFLKNHCHPETGLCTDIANFDGSLREVVWNPNAGSFNYDSWKTLINWAFDWSWWRKDPFQVELSNRIQSFFVTSGMDAFGSRFTHDGNLLDGTPRAGLGASAAVVSLAADHEMAGDFVKRFWFTPLPESLEERYSDGILYMMAMLHCSGRFKIWKP